MYQTLSQRTKPRQLLYLFISRHEQKEDKMRHLLYQASLWCELQTNRIWLWTRWWGWQGSPQPQHRCSASASHAQTHCQRERDHHNYSSGGKAGAWRTQYGNPNRPLLRQGCQTTVWSFWCFLFRGRNACTQKPFLNSIPRWSFSKGFSVLSSNKDERLYVAETGLLAVCFTMDL